MPTIEINNQKPAVMTEDYMMPLSNNIDPYAIVKKDIVSPLFTPLTPGFPVEMKITEDNTTRQLTTDDITNLLFKCSDDRVDPESEDTLKDIFSQSLAYFDKSQPIRKIYATQAGVRLNLPLPCPKVIYRPQDVSDSAKQLLAGQLSPDCWFANLAFYTKVEAMGYYFANSHEFENFKNYFATETNKLQGLLSPDTQNLIKSFKSVFLHTLTESLVLRDDEIQNNEPYSFARLLMFYLNLYKTQSRKNKDPLYKIGSLPFIFAETILPKNIIFVNVEKHAHASLAEIEREWAIINSAIAMKPKVFSLNQIQKLTAVARMAKRMASGSAGLTGPNMKSAAIHFSSKPLTAIDLYTIIMKIYKHTAFVQRSENAVKRKKLTYQKQSRRHPDNPDIPGKTNSTSYKPDLHIYLDCSGSISEKDYKDAIMSCIKLASKMGVNFYFNSFSHILSQSTKLNIAGHSTKQIYNAFTKVPKVGGGTDYEQIWHYINRSDKLRKQVSIVITDYEWTAPNHYVRHPEHLYYAPISASAWGWKSITRNAEDFLKSMLSIDPHIRKKILM